MAGSLRGASGRRTARLSRAWTAGKAFGLVLPVIFGATSPTGAQGLTGERLYDFCRDRDAPNHVAESHVCLGFIRGIIDGARLQALRTANQSIPEHYKTLAMCEPSGTSSDQAIAVVLRFIEARPDVRPLPAAVVVFQALAAAWPCSP